jgi:hypothetical protein
MSDALRFYGKLESNRTNGSTKNGTGPNENDIIAQWNQDISLECILQYIIGKEFK